MNNVLNEFKESIDIDPIDFQLIYKVKEGLIKSKNSLLRHSGVCQYPLPPPGEGTTAWMQEVEQRREQLSRMGVIGYWMLVATDFLSSRDISHILWVVFTSMTVKTLDQTFLNNDL